MKVQDQDIYHGAALTQVVEHESFKALNKGSGRYGHYLVNADCNVFVKYSTHEDGPWIFNFQPDHLEPIRNVLGTESRAFVCLVCGEKTVCALSSEEIQEVINLHAGNPQWVRVQFPSGGSCRVQGSAGTLSRTVPHNSFPNKLFE
ncbi:MULTISPECIES: hypothetical protein [unclassified Halorhodospira]|uniref:hypothetical protein n=1 Tax=unclassified Halorhodospira TaxID=2626748 RepID=UPI001EE84AAA|nr:MULTISPECIES: hypothetical protein [unclassified Halorhodospira]MCG5541894.1 hypothetical protein [Halorhodospira sp. M39old]MCG5546960.1 hypothetical protein [Halorhodospira sp. M38]